MGFPDFGWDFARARRRRAKKKRNSVRQAVARQHSLVVTYENKHEWPRAW